LCICELIMNGNGNVRAIKDSSAELKLIRSELKQQVNCLNKSALVSITDAAGRIIYVNSMFCRISKYSKQELLG